MTLTPVLLTVDFLSQRANVSYPVRDLEIHLRIHMNVRPLKTTIGEMGLPAGFLY